MTSFTSQKDEVIKLLLNYGILAPIRYTFVRIDHMFSIGIICAGGVWDHNGLHGLQNMSLCSDASANYMLISGI